MKKHYLLVLVLLVMLNGANAQNYVWDWAKTAVSPNQSVAVETATDADGNIYVGGNFQSASLTFGSTTLSGTAENNNMFLVKYDEDGNVLWAKGGTPANASQIVSLTTDTAGNLYVTGSFQNQLTLGSTTLTATGHGAFLAKYNAEGIVQWAIKPTGTAITSLMDVFYKDNNLYVCGIYNGAPVTIGAITLSNIGNNDSFAAKFDINGNILWATRIAGNNVDNAATIIADGLGNVYVAGSYNSASISAGSGSVNNMGSQDLFLAKFNQSGQNQWIKGYGGTGYDIAVSLCNNGPDDIYLLGRLYSVNATVGSVTLTSVNGSEILVAKISSAGNTLWAHLSGGEWGDNATSMEISHDDNLFITGYTYSSSFQTGGLTVTSPNFSNIFIIKMLPTGVADWVEMVPVGDGTEAYSLSAGPQEEIYIAGKFDASATFGNTTISNNMSGMFISKFAPETMGINDLMASSVVVYPNPAKDRLNISSEIESNSAYYISDITGRTISSGAIVNKGVNTSLLPSGIYFLNINNTITKFIKE
jgi:hypothetical protein